MKQKEVAAERESKQKSQKPHIKKKKKRIFHTKEARIQRNKHYVAIFHAEDGSNVPTK